MEKITLGNYLQLQFTYNRLLWSCLEYVICIRHVLVNLHNPLSDFIHYRGLKAFSCSWSRDRLGQLRTTIVNRPFIPGKWPAAKTEQISNDWLTQPVVLNASPVNTVEYISTLVSFFSTKHCRIVLYDVKTESGVLVICLTERQ